MIVRNIINNITRLNFVKYDIISFQLHIVILLDFILYY